jgi:thiamine-phosphate pyrophosphorylase
VAKQLCDGGADLIQLRAKGMDEPAVQCLAEAILPITRAAGVGLVINDYPTLAETVGAEFCHLGQEDFFNRGLNRVAALRGPGSALRFGLSTHAPEEAARAIAAGADYLAVGPVYATPTKPGVKPVTLNYVRWATANLAMPWFAIGGINLSSLQAVMEAGAKRVCVVSAILQAPDVKAVCAEFKRRLTDK